MKETPSAFVVMNCGVEKHGSFEDFMISLACAARERGWNLTYILPGVGVSDVQTAVEQAGAKVMITQHPWKSRTGLREIASHILKARPDMVDFHFCDPVRFMPLFLRCRLRRVPVMFHYHGEIRPLALLGWRNRHLSSLRLSSYLWSIAVTVSHANARFLQALHIAAPIQVVYNGVDVPQLQHAYAAAQVPSPDAAREGVVRCVYMGTLTRRKRVDMLLRAFALVRQQVPETTLTVIGGGELDDQLRTQARELGIENAVDFKSLLKQYPFGILKACDIFVSASESESFGLVFAEAMTFCLPIVACRVGGIPEVIADGETGKLVPANQPEEFAAALLSLVRDAGLRRTMGDAGGRRVVSAFQLSRCVEETMDAFAAASRRKDRS